MEKTYQIEKPADFENVIKDILTNPKISTKESLIIALQGDLGAGKTTFTQELAKYLGVTETVNSPTFTLMKQYDLDHIQFDTLVHMDAYRLESETETKPLRLKELFLTPRTIVCVEWPEVIPASIPAEAVWMKIKIGKDELRIVTVKMGVEDSVD